MSLPFLETFSLDFSPSQTAALEDLVQRSKDGKTIGLDEAQALLNSIRAGTRPVFVQPVFGLELLEGCKVATALEAARADLTTLFQQLRAAESVTTARNELNRSVIKKLHQAILRLTETVIMNRLRRLNQDFTDVKFIDFANSINDSDVPNRARVEADTGELVTGTQEVRRMLSRTGSLRPNFTSTIISAGSNPDTKSFVPANAVRASDQYVWAEVLLADALLKGTYDSVEYDGAVVALDVHLPQAERINEIKLAPFGRYNLRLVRLQYLDGPTYLDIPGVAAPIELDLDATAIRFPAVTARTVRLVFVKQEGRRASFVLEKGQVKRSGWLNLLLDRSFETAVNAQGTLPASLRDDRRARASQALHDALLKTDAQTSQERYRDAIQEVLAIEDRDLITISKFQYVVGLRALEINYKRYTDEGQYQSPPMQAGGSVFAARLETTETHPTFDDTVSPANITSIEYALDLGGGRQMNILPEGTGRVESERLKFDANRIARSRFNVDAVHDVVVRRDGTRLTLGSDYTLTALAGSQAIVTITTTAWNPIAVYSVSYNVRSGQDEIDILANFASIKPVAPLEFNANGDRLVLPSNPFVLREITQDKMRWSQPDPFDAAWVYRGPSTRGAADDPPYVIRIDGENYGTHRAITLAANVAIGATSMVVSATGFLDDAAVPSEGAVKINDELIYYTQNSVGGSTSQRTLSGLIRGYRNTKEAAHVSTDPVVWQTNETYEPIVVKVNGARARNLTDYAGGRNPAFSDSGPVQYIQIGNTLYFDRPISGKVHVWYRSLVDAVVVKATMYSDLASKELTPVLTDYLLKLKTATL